MPSITKDSGPLTATTEVPARPGSTQTASSDSAAKQQPVALEIPVTVNGARTIEGSDKREPFSETTKTVLVFGAGAVIRLTSAVSPGQLLFLTNERTKKEVVCQVVKSKNYRSISGYVELEFTEPAVGFWGMRFPGDRLNSGAQPAPPLVRPAANSGSTVPPRPVAPKIELPAVKDLSGNPSVRPATPAPVAQSADSKLGEAKSVATGPSVHGKPASPAAPAGSIVPPPLDSAALLGGHKPKSSDASVPATRVTAKPAAETPLVEPWLKKAEPGRTTPAKPIVAGSAESSAKPSGSESSLQVNPTFGLSSSSNQPASILAPSESPASLLTVDLSSLAPFFDVKPAASKEEPPSSSPTPAAGEKGTEELKQHTARLQEQLSNLNFTDQDADSSAKPTKEVGAAPATEQAISFSGDKTVHESAAQILEDASASSASPILPEALEPAKPAQQASYSPSLEALEQEELKIPAWLEPLARNASAPSSTQELVLREKGKRKAERGNPEEAAAEVAAPVQREYAFESRVPEFGSALPLDERKSSSEGPARKSGKGLVFAGIAAAVAVVAAGSWWYLNQQSARSQANVVASQTPAFSVPEQNSQTNMPKETASETNLSAQSGSSAPETFPTKPNSAAANGSATATRSSQGKSNPLNGGNMVTASASTPVPREPDPVRVRRR